MRLQGKAEVSYALYICRCRQGANSRGTSDLYQAARRQFLEDSVAQVLADRVDGGDVHYDWLRCRPILNKCAELLAHEQCEREVSTCCPPISIAPLTPDQRGR